MNVQLKAEDLHHILSEAILLQLTQEKRDEFMKAALASLLARTDNQYDRRSVIEKAFHEAAGDVARKEAGKMMEADPKFQAKLKELIVEAVERVFGANREKTIEKIADAIRSTFDKPDRY